MSSLALSSPSPLPKRVVRGVEVDIGENLLLVVKREGEGLIERRMILLLVGVGGRKALVERKQKESRAPRMER
jgi:hypothetical protein